MTSTTPDRRFVSYFRAGYPLLHLVTAEEARAEAEVVQAAIAEDVARQDVFIWTTTEGMFNIKKPTVVNDKLKDPKAFLEYLRNGEKTSRTVYIARDLHAFFGNPIIVRLLRDLSREFKQRQDTVVIISPVAKLPPELTRDIVQVEFELPSVSQIANIFDRLFGNNKAKLKAKGVEVSDDERERIVSAAAGLTSIEAENAFSKAIVEGASGLGRISDLVLAEKANAVKKSGVLEYYRVNEDINSIGGLEVLKAWLQKRSRATTKKAREFGLPIPKGILLTGVPGSGKSLTAKAAASIMQVPLIRFDISRVFGGLVGSSEQATRDALATIDAMGMCVVFIDEMEKAFAGAGGTGGGDNGVTRRVFGTFLTWMQEKTTPSFIVATTNSIEGIPPEMLRRGRFDENFFVGLPNPAERSAILDIHLKKRNRHKVGIDIARCVEASNLYTGAELEYAIIDGLYTAFDAERDLTTEDVIQGIMNTNPISKAFEAQLKEMTDWARLNAVNASRPTGHTEPGQGGRTLTI